MEYQSEHPAEIKGEQSTCSQMWKEADSNAKRARDQAEKTRRAVAKMANIQRALENCYSDVRLAIEYDQRGENNGRILERIEHTLANVLTVIEIETNL
jgi:hypothetical protein